MASPYREGDAVVARATVASPWLPDRVATLTPSGDVVLSSDSRRTLDYLEQATLLRPREEPRLVPGADHVPPPGARALFARTAKGGASDLAEEGEA